MKYLNDFASMGIFPEKHKVKSKKQHRLLRVLTLVIGKKPNLETQYSLFSSFNFIQGWIITLEIKQIVYDLCLSSLINQLTLTKIEIEG